MSKIEYWYCANCKEELSGSRVAYQELCDTCGHPVEWIEGIDIERLEELIEADKDGRCVLLPCKVGDTVYGVTRCSDIMMHHDSDYIYGTGAIECPFEQSCKFEECNDEQSQILETAITNWWLQGDENHEEPEAFLEHIQKSYYLQDFGKTVFLTREEAEATLGREGISR